MDQQDPCNNPDVTSIHLKSQPEIVPDSTFGEMVPFVDWTQPMEHWAGHNFEAMSAVQNQTTFPMNSIHQVSIIFCISSYKSL